MSPRSVVEMWIDRFDAGDARGLAELYHEHAINHQVALEPVAGREPIQAMFERDFASGPMTCIVDTIHEAGDVIAAAIGIKTR